MAKVRIEPTSVYHGQASGVAKQLAIIAARLLTRPARDLQNDDFSYIALSISRHYHDAMYIRRLIEPILRQLTAGPLGRGVILTGARQTGKTTLLQREFVPPYEYHSFDELLTRETIARRPAEEWARQGRRFVFDEVQKAPEFLGTVKTLLDRPGKDVCVILSGSAQIQLLRGVRETLAGRVVTRELFPLTVAELAGARRPFVLELLRCTTSEEVRRLVEAAAFLRGGSLAAAREAFGRVLGFGGMPPVAALDAPEHRWEWLAEYCQTYLQRDLADLARIGDLDDFVRLEKRAAARTATSVNFADLARDADMSPLTAKKYLRYLELSYQTFTLEAYRGSSSDRLLKAPRLHFVDLGVQRVLSRWREGATGPQVETAVVAEIHKLVRTLRIDVELSHLRTKDGREVDLLTRLPGGAYLAWEIKSSERAASADARHLRNLAGLLDGPLLAGFVIHQGDRVEAWPGDLYALPAATLFADLGAESARQQRDGPEAM
jgi:predicted AAA+ superfamily ATPase